MGPRRGVKDRMVIRSQTRRGPFYARSGNSKSPARVFSTEMATSAQGVVPRNTVLKSVLAARALKPHTPYIADAWEGALARAGLGSRYPLLVEGIRHGFRAGVPKITQTFCPPNRDSIHEHISAYQDIVAHEISSGRYFGPVSQAAMEDALGPFQTSPLSVIPKANKPEKLRLIQNLSFPHQLNEKRSINSFINSDDFPCTWGTFSAFATLCAGLPPGSQGAVRDVAEAYRTIPLHPSQWPGMVIRHSGEDEFMFDGNLCFGLASGSGCYGYVGDAGADVMRSRGIGPLTKWVDDHVFLRIMRRFREAYNDKRRELSRKINQNGGEKRSGGWIWFSAGILEDGRVDECVEDNVFPLLDLSTMSARSAEDMDFTYCFSDIDDVSKELGIPWQIEKDVPFSHEFPFTGFMWNIKSQTVSIPPAKKQKYLSALLAWSSKRTHTLEEVQKLYGKLRHTSLVVPEGRAYLTNLESMLGIFGNRPFMPRTPPKQTPVDIEWWCQKLSEPQVERRIPGPCTLCDPHAYSDASSETGIAIVVGDQWRAWELVEGWQSNGRDIAWAEAVGFELLVKTLLRFGGTDRNIKVYGDNRGVVEGWWNGRSRNEHVNTIFCRIHQYLIEAKSRIHTRYVESAGNPADNPSRGIFPPESLLLPPVEVPCEVSMWVKTANSKKRDTKGEREGSKPKSTPGIRSTPAFETEWDPQMGWDVW